MSKYDKLKEAGKELFIDLYLEFYGDEVISVLKKFLAPLSPKDLEQFVADGSAPPIPTVALKKLKGYEDYIEKIKPEEVFEWLNKARPDLGEVLVSLGDQGAEYVVMLKQFIIDNIKETEAASEKMVKLHCEACGRDWELPKSEAERVTVCPFCGESAKSGDEEAAGEDDAEE